MPTRREIIARIETPLTALYGEREARQIARIVVMELGGLCLTDLVAEPNKELGIDELDRIIGELAAGRPLQYVLGHTEFYGLDFQVREGVLIPRPETEELVRWIAESPAPDNPAVLDVGTGSGILAIAALKLGAASAEGVDIDPVAVRTAGENAALNGVQDKLTVLVGDLSDKASGKYDIITANIVANAIISLAPAVPGLMAENATFIASGIIDSRKDEVIAALEAAGLTVQEVKEKRGWECIICKKMN